MTEGGGGHRVRRALLSLADKAGLAERARRLAAMEVELVSTGGTAQILRDAGLTVREVDQLTGFPEMLGGRVKTLHPAIHGGLLFRRDADGDEARRREVTPIDLVVVDLYPFERTVASGADAEVCIDNIDIGGPTLLRSAAKNARWVVACAGVADFEAAILEMEQRDGTTDLAFRRRLAARAFCRCAAYDAAVAGWCAAAAGERFGEWFCAGGKLELPLRYGENPHQGAAAYRLPGHDRPGALSARRIQGKPLSFNNIADLDAAFELVAEFGDDRAAVAIVKHAAPCGAALGDTVETAYRAALGTDPVSAFGGIVAVNRPLDAATVGAIIEIFTEAVIAPDADDDALEILSMRPNLRVLLTGGLPQPADPAIAVRSVAGGLLVQERDSARPAPEGWRCVTERRPDEDEFDDLVFAWRVAKHVRSNAIVFAGDGEVRAISGGQTSRLDAAEIAARKLGGRRARAVASDAFFPFADGLEQVVAAGATAVIQPGGSLRDGEVIAAADRLGAAMLFTGRRHFRH